MVELSWTALRVREVLKWRLVVVGALGWIGRLVGMRAERSGGGWIGARTYGSEDLEVFEDCCVAVGSVLRR